ncbi:DNA replication ATP-dependent helicase Dna2 [Fusarium subglutinans]|uniref:DNA replication ATP-dependent helicase/nuclease n=1 Tax=Gibberella subglutinans TaxID=42677 RepID=A0A8H5V585_GIBSU|nr:DNA replication ATP-dependent helicase Dna2 [Fusarium subglutinans]KAF5608779.1 DNA replication ATP-dependent helicase Dna2 [Fusarium subglutinans]
MPLQKSYSDQVGRTKRLPWQRSRSNPVQQTPNPRALQPVSEVTKNKLNKFQYHPVNGETATEGTENDQNVSNNRIKDDTTTTPATRLTWQELLEPAGGTEDDTTTSPNDRLLWDNRQDTLYMPALSPMLNRKGRKRARSSSPVSSPVADKSNNPSVNVRKLAQALKSPHADPTLELWDRYSLNGTDNAVDGIVFATAIETNGWRIQSQTSNKLWPELAQKEKGGKINFSSINGPSEEPHEEPQDGPESPSPKKRRIYTTSSGSPRLSKTQARSQTPAQHPAQPHVQVPAQPPVQLPPPEPASSDYGDDDFDEFDDDTIMQLEASINTTQLETNPLPEVVAAENDPVSETDHKTPENFDGKLDEFDDLDDDFFDEAEDLITADSQQVSQALATTELDDLDDEFGDAFGGDFDFEAVELAATQAAQNCSGDSRKPRTIQRYLVTNVLEGEYTDQYGHARPEKILLIQADNSKDIKTVHLRASWFDTPAHAEAYVHIIGDFSLRGQCIVDDGQNLLILHPDQLISATVVADSFGCMRRAVLQDRVKATSPPTPPLIYGTMLHEIFQEALLANKWDLPFLCAVIDRITEKHVEDLYTIKVGIPSAREHLQSKMTELSYWAGAFVSSRPKEDAVVEDRNGKKANMAVTKLLDVEEHVWSPMYGLKGNIDATVEVAMQDGNDIRTLTVPFEVKTGKHANSNHMAQTALYTLLLSDRYDIEIAYGILYYMETSKTMRIPAIRHELRHMIMQRNQLACYVRERSVQLPPMLKSKHMCGKCYAKTSCFIYHRLADDGDGDSSGMNEKFHELVKHLTPHHQQFFIKWENLLTKEEKESQKTKRELWTMTSAEREKKSRCFADVIIEEGSASVDTDNPRINRYHYTFVKRVQVSGFSFLESELSVGEPIVVSDEEGHFALAIGYVTAVKRQRISVAVDRRLHNARIRQPGFDESDNQIFASIMDVAHEGATQDEATGKIKEAPIRYRLDQDEFSNGMATVRNNLVQMMADDIVGSRQIRRLTVDLEAPRFKTAPTQYIVSDRDSLNVDQHRAIEKVMSAQDYALVLGMPGTGKTTTIAHIIRALTSQGKSVLLTSHTHTAVDNILLKLKADKIPILRLGAPAKVHPDVRDFAILAGHPMKSFDEIKNAWHGTPIVATTCLGINHPVFHERSFDYCIVDEASQITLPICAGPIRMARTFVLVGDHNQLPPVVKNEEARQGGLDVSLFKLLSDTHPESVVNLEHQYRMCEDIMTLSNTLIYNGRLRCGTEQLRRRKLEVPRMEALMQRHYDASTINASTPRSFCAAPGPNRCWLYDLLDSETRVRFVNTDTIQPPVREEAQGKRIVNSAEVRIVSQLVDSLLTVGVPDSEIGVMTHYRAQLFMLKDKLKMFSGVEMHTTDRFQGRDKEVIVLSLVRSNEACNIGDLLKDWRRINVAFTRAKTKLLVVGSKSTLKGSGSDSMLSQFISLMEDRNWIYEMPANALVNHYFDDFGTQITATGPTQRIKSPRKKASGKENRRRSPKTARISDKALLKGKLITRDILNEMTNGAYV